MFKRIIFIFIVLFISTSIFAQQTMNKPTLNFHMAMKRLDINEMEKLLKKNKDKIDLKGFPYLATEYGVANLEIANFLIKNGADVNARTEYGTTPLMVAIRMNQLEVINLLLENGAEKTINAKERVSNDTALGIAIGYFTREKTKEQIALITKLIEKGADINQTNGIEFVFSTALSNGDFDFVKLLLDNDLYFGMQPSGYWLNIARGYGEPNIEMFKLLMAHGIKPEYDFDTNRLLQTICRSGNSRDRELLELFINNGLDINSYTDDNMSLLTAALETKRFDTAKTLIQNKAIVNCVVSGTTPLITAIKNRAPIEIIKMLLDNGADPNIAEVVSKKTALDYAKNRGDNALISLIQERM